jgi:carbonic anhydrase/acetyltransferase-like protein (isoleucine patch superfamily)
MRFLSSCTSNAAEKILLRDVPSDAAAAAIWYRRATRHEASMPTHPLGPLAPVLPKGPHFIAPGARLVGDIVIEDNVIVMFGAVLRAEFERIHIGAGSNVQDNVVMHVDPGFPLALGKNVSIGHSAIVHGCTVEEGSVIGMGSTIMNGAVIGRNSLVGANALVTKGTVFPPRSMIMGTPAKRVRELTDEEVEGCLKTAAGYVSHIPRYRAAFPD